MEMEIVLVAISLASLVCNVALVRRFLQTKVATLVVTEYLPLPVPLEEWQDAVEEQPELEPEPPPAAAVAPDNSPWVNRSGIQQGVNSVPAPPIQPIQRPPLARPDGFVR